MKGDISKLCQLDRYALDVEAEGAAANLQTYSADLAKAKISSMDAELNLKKITYQVELDIRRDDPKAYGLDKFTEASITALVGVSDKVETAKQIYIEAKGEQLELEANVEALREKCDQIKNLVSLWIGGYFAEPSSGKSRKAEMGK